MTAVARSPAGPSVVLEIEVMDTPPCMSDRESDEGPSSLTEAFVIPNRNHDTETSLTISPFPIHTSS